MKLRTRKKLIKIMTIFICILFVFSAIVSAVMATETMHLELCHEDDCPICMLIKTAINFSKNLKEIIQYVILLNIVIVLIHTVISKICYRITTTLVEQRVRLDE